MAGRAAILTVRPMTAYIAPLPINTDQARTSARAVHPAVRPSRLGRRDGKLALLSGLESLAGCRHRSLVTLAATADLVTVEAGTVLGQGHDLSRFWWMPIDGWLLVSTGGKQAVTVPAGRSWTGGTEGRISALRGGRVLMCSVGALDTATANDSRLAAAIRSSRVDV
jgi:hypothetical protein